MKSRRLATRYVRISAVAPTVTSTTIATLGTMTANGFVRSTIYLASSHRSSAASSASKGGNQHGKSEASAGEDREDADRVSRTHPRGAAPGLLAPRLRKFKTHTTPQHSILSILLILSKQKPPTTKYSVAGGLKSSYTKRKLKIKAQRNT